MEVNIMLTESLLPTSHPSISQQNKQNFHSIVSKECGHCTFKSVVFGWALP